jgi:bacillolysin
MKFYSFIPLLGLIFLCQWGNTQTKPALGGRVPSFIRPTGGYPAAAQADLLAQHLALSEEDELRPVKSWRDALGFTHEKYQQYYRGVRVEGATWTVHSDQQQVYLMSGSYRPMPQIDLRPRLTAASALRRAQQQVGISPAQWLETENPAELVIYNEPQGARAPLLAYKLELYALEPLYRAYVFIDAQTGGLLTEHSLIHTTDVPASGASRYNGNVSFTADFTGLLYRLRQKQQGNGVETYTMKNGTSYSNAGDVTSSSTVFNSDPTGVQAHWGAEITHQYFLQKHNRNSFDGAGAAIRSYVHFGSNYVNAFWDGQRVTYGDGNGSSFGPLVSLDIVGHEITHGVTQHTADLVYNYESGALNESFSDIFGEAIEHYAIGSNDWQVGADITLNGGGGIRSLKNPNQFGDPDTYKGNYWYSGTGDNGGVHINSGVQNKWFYLLSVGESGVNDFGKSYAVTGIGIEKAAAIAYRNLSVYLNSSSSYSDAREGAIQAARDLFGEGSPEVKATADAWYAVGVGSPAGTPTYCSSGAASAAYEWIAGVSVGSFTNTSGGAGYTDFTHKTIDLSPGQSYKVSLTPGFSANTWQETWRIWIDFNNDKDFNDPGELVFSPATLSATVVSGSIAIPAGVSGTTRMRVAMKWESPSTPCEQFNYGEVEDYTVAFGAAPGDTQAPSAPANLQASNTTPTSTTLSWSPSTDNVGVTGYKVYLGNNLHGSTNGTSYPVAGLTANTNYTFSVRACDATGNLSAPASINLTTPSIPSDPVILFTHYFETGWDGWIDGGVDCFRYYGSKSYQGNYSIRLRDNSGIASSMTSSPIDASLFNRLDLEFTLLASGFSPGEELQVYFFNGEDWHMIRSFVGGTDFSNKVFTTVALTLLPPAAGFSANTQFRLQCNASDNSDMIYIDQVILRGVPIGSGSPTDDEDDGRRINITTRKDSRGGQPATGEVLVFPNPTSRLLNVRLGPEQSPRTLRLISGSGVLLLKQDAPPDGDIALDLSMLAPGMYVLVVETAGEVIHRRVIKQ